MTQLTAVLAALALAASAAASFDGNMNYLSPSKRHEELGIDTARLVKRDLQKTIAASQVKFTHGVASGDPYADSVILWTRASPLEGSSDSLITVTGTAPVYDHDNLRYVTAAKEAVCVNWKVSTDEKFKKGRIVKGKVWTSYEVDWTVKVEAKGLKAFTTYYYQFNVCDSDVKSPVGRTKTIPKAKDRVKRDIGFAVFSCANYPQGFFNAYGNSARKDNVDYVIHLGDYIYEYPDGLYGSGKNISRIPEPADHFVTSLLDYRKRYAQYRADPDLAESHRRFAWISVWDDHEVANNAWKAGSQILTNSIGSYKNAKGLDFDQIKGNALRAHFEWMPLRQVDVDDNLRIWRDFQFGDLLDLIMLDTRQYSRDFGDLSVNFELLKNVRDDQARTLMGSRQEAWFYRKLKESMKRKAKWRIIGQQIVFAEVYDNTTAAGLGYNPDAWDGYRANRNRTLETIINNKIENNIILSGDSHANYVSDVTWNGKKEYDPKTGKGAVAVEFAGSAVSSPGPVGQFGALEDAQKEADWVVNNSTSLQWQESYYRGYYEIKVNYKQVTADFFGIPTLRERNGKEIKLASFQVNQGENRLSRNADGSAVVGTPVAGAVKGGNVDLTKAEVKDTSQK